MKKLLTIGMAHKDDWDGAAFTIQNLKFQIMSMGIQDRCEIIVIDDSNDSPSAKELERLCNWGGVQARFIKAHIGGTAQPRNQIFAEAEGEYVLCLDCHVLLHPNALTTLLDYYKTNDNTYLIQGPILYNDLHQSSCMFDPVWRAEMYGIWAEAWVHESQDQSHTFCIRPQPHDQFTAHDLNGFELSLSDIKTDAKYSTHKQLLRSNGYKLAEEVFDYFEIPAQGLGLFSARKETWLGFNKHFRGFGGEECYIHEKYRQARRKTICLSGLKWWHRFGRIGGPPYTPLLTDKVRNYVLGHQELGKPFDDIREHFVDTKKMSIETWEKLIADPEGFQTFSTHPPVKSSETNGQTDPLNIMNAKIPTIEELFNHYSESKTSYINRHLPILKEYASKADSIIEFGEARESTVALLAGQPKRIVSAQQDNKLHSLLEKLYLPLIVDSRFDFGTFDDSYELVFLDVDHNAESTLKYLNQLNQHNSIYCIIHDTILHGDRGRNGEPGIKDAVVPWLLENPDWFIVYHTDLQYGLTILSRVASERPERPVVVWPPGYGPGTELKKIFADLGVPTTPTCKCNSYANQMDRMGSDWCYDNRETVINWLMDSWAEMYAQRTDTQKQSLSVWAAKLAYLIGGDTLARTGAGRLLRKAIKRARAVEKSLTPS